MVSFEVSGRMIILQARTSFGSLTRKINTYKITNSSLQIFLPYRISIPPCFLFNYTHRKMLHPVCVFILLSGRTVSFRNCFMNYPYYQVCLPSLRSPFPGYQKVSAHILQTHRKRFQLPPVMGRKSVLYPYNSM